MPTDNYLVILVRTIIVVVQLINAFTRKYPKDSIMPLVVSCSAVISANYHRLDKGEDAYFLLVRWGVVGEQDGRKVCSFATMRDVEVPKSGDIANAYVADETVKRVEF